MAEENLNILQDTKKIEFETLDKYIKKYPWLSILHIIWLVKIKKERPKEFNSELKKHIIYLRDRKKLYRIINDDLWVEMVNEFITEKKDQISSNNKNSNGDKELLDFVDNPEEETESTGNNSNEKESSEPETLEKKEGTKNEQDNHPGFYDWIAELENKEEKEDDLIEKFLEIDPGPIRADKESRLRGDISKNSVEESESFITDTLAKIYIKQGLYSKAIFAYKKLSLKYPEKSVYFASQIEEIKKLINN